MGEVYRADDITLNQSVALKFLPALFGKDQKWLDRFRNEVRLARQVTHPNVCRVFDIGEFQGEQFISMEYVDGENLASLLRRIGRLPHDKAMQMARQLCAGLSAAHDRGVLHRDLKPANVMIDGRGSVRITDFGLAAPRDQLGNDAVRAGTPAYMSARAAFQQTCHGAIRTSIRWASCFTKCSPAGAPFAPTASANTKNCIRLRTPRPPV